jgi:hypothetical protein
MYALKILQYHSQDPVLRLRLRLQWQVTQHMMGILLILRCPYPALLQWYDFRHHEFWPL